MSLCHHHSAVATPCPQCLNSRSIHDTIAVHSPSSTAILGTVASQLSYVLASPNSPHGAAIDRSLAEGALSKFGACCIDAAAREAGPSILSSLETILLRDQASRAEERGRAEKASLEHARLVAEKVAEETASRVAPRIGQLLAPSIELLTRQAAAAAGSGESEDKTEPRKATQEATVWGLFSVLRALGSAQPFSLVPFTGAEHKQLSSLAAVNEVLGRMVYQRGSPALGPLETRI
ncbi:hypothetical protein B0T26DRAFT_725424 [Lasiosphaeria miniovina]|uniref:Uncharacterized protein n=1 Tax=Lasiosphaeria miniovina TaxID=1954250 RepID=A0AA40DJP1_9PEZI|nr:uncharacterized protein B0T26DRAFT_725424 [Lasiosphaeria miniovina]KAK0706099.1 hypothetical protein B0T26DRAFT_725424 [Lasiosphaeria miniovina]